jgi:hypothetical protein
LHMIMLLEVVCIPRCFPDTSIQAWNCCRPRPLLKLKIALCRSRLKSLSMCNGRVVCQIWSIDFRAHEISFTLGTLAVL